VALLHELFTNAREALDRATTHPINDDEERMASHSFGSTVGAIGRWLVTHPEDRIEIDAFAQEMGMRVDDRTPLDRWWLSIWNAADAHEFRAYELEQALTLRSDLQFFIDIFRGRLRSNWIDELELEALDARIRDTADATGPMSTVPTPPDIPPHHVWWTWGFR